MCQFIPKAKDLWVFLATLYKGESAWEIDEEWIPFDVTDNILAVCIDSVYDAIYQRI